MNRTGIHIGYAGQIDRWEFFKELDIRDESGQKYNLEDLRKYYIDIYKSRYDINQKTKDSLIFSTTATEESVERVTELLFARHLKEMLGACEHFGMDFLALPQEQQIFIMDCVSQYPTDAREDESRARVLDRLGISRHLYLAAMVSTNTLGRQWTIFDETRDSKWVRWIKEVGERIKEKNADLLKNAEKTEFRKMSDVQKNADTNAISAQFAVFEKIQKSLSTDRERENNLLNLLMERRQDSKLTYLRINANGELCLGNISFNSEDMLSQMVLFRNGKELDEKEAFVVYKGMCELQKYLQYARELKGMTAYDFSQEFLSK